MPVYRLWHTPMVSHTSSQGTSVIGKGKCFSGHCTMWSDKPQEREMGRLARHWVHSKSAVLMRSSRLRPSSYYARV